MRSLVSCPTLRVFTHLIDRYFNRRTYLLPELALDAGELSETDRTLGDHR